MAARNMDDIVKDIKDLWIKKEITGCPFWGSLTASYYESDYRQISNNRFYSEISFYPKLIVYLSEILPDTANIEITFFSTLLPRYYWNFPLYKRIMIGKKRNENELDDFFISRTAKFLDLYRNAISNSIESNKVKIKRIMIVSDEDKDYLFNTRLFTVNDLKEDRVHFVNEKKINWEDVTNNSKIYTKYNLGIEYSLFDKIYNPIVDENNYPLQTKELRNDLKDNSFYAFNNKKVNSELSVYDYYVEKLHSENQAFISVNSRKNAGNKITINGNTIIKRNLDSLLSNDFKPDLAYICIKENKKKDKNIVLNTYMDIKNDIVKLHVIDQDNINDSTLFNNLMNDINKFDNNNIFPLYEKGDNELNKKLKKAISRLNSFKKNPQLSRFDVELSEISIFISDSKNIYLIDEICNLDAGPETIISKYKKIKKI